MITPLRPFFYRASTPVLPTVYSESLSYLEDIDKLGLQVQKLTSTTNDLISYYNGIESLLAEMRSTLDDIQEAQTEMENRLNEYINQINQQFADLENSVNQQVTDALASIDGKISALRSELIEMINNDLSQFEEALDQLRQEMNANNIQLINEVEYKLQQFLNSIPDVQNVIIIDPFTGQPANIQDVVNKFFYFLNETEISVAQYDGLNLSVDEYDNWNKNGAQGGLTVDQYDYYGYQYLVGIDIKKEMFSPLDGHPITEKQAIRINTDIMKQAGTLTIGEYDELGVTVGEFDSKQLTVFQFDWESNRNFVANATESEV